jgi:hypothetical protein
MKPGSLFLAITLAFLTTVLASGCAHQQNAVQTAQSYPNSTNAAYVTGSYLLQNVDRNGPVTNGKTDVRVIDRSDINGSGGADVRQSLRQLGVTP